MARTLAELPKGSRITDYISLGVVAKAFPVAAVKSVLAATGRGSLRQRDLPAHVVVYYVIALALYMQSSYREVLRCLLEGIQWLLNPTVRIKVTGKSGISQARTRLGVEPLRQLHDEVVRPIATKATRGAWYRGWRLVSLDGSTLDVADERATKKPLDVLGRAGARAPIPRSDLSRWWKTAPMCCLVLRWETMERENWPWPKECFLVEQEMLCLADRVFSDSNSGIKPVAPVRICSGGSGRTCGCPVRNVWRTVPI